MKPASKSSALDGRNYSRLDTKKPHLPNDYSATQGWLRRSWKGKEKKSSRKRNPCFYCFFFLWYGQKGQVRSWTDRWTTHEPGEVESRGSSFHGGWFCILYIYPFIGTYHTVAHTRWRIERSKTRIYFLFLFQLLPHLSKQHLFLIMCYLFLSTIMTHRPSTIHNIWFKESRIGPLTWETFVNIYVVNIRLQ